MPRFEPRSRYRPSGRFAAQRLAIALPLLALAALAIAIGYCLMLGLEFYFSALSIMFPVIAAAAATERAVHFSHLRNRWLAGVIGALIGLSAYLGYFHLDQCWRWNAPVTAVGRLPGYIAFRMETDRWRWVDKAAVLVPQPAAAGIVPQRPLANARFASWNWAGFLFESIILSMVPLAVGVARAGTPYSEKRQAWCRQLSLCLSRESGESLKRAIAEETIAEWVAVGPQRVQPHIEHCKAAMWYAPREGGEEIDAEVFLSVDGSPRYLLDVAEAAEFVALLPELQEIAGPAQDQLAAEAETTAGDTSARIWKVPPPYAGQSQNVKNRILGRLLVYCWMILPPVLAVAVLIGGTFAIGRWGVLPGFVPDWVLIAFVITTGLGALIVVRFSLDPERAWWFEQSRRFDHGLIRKAIAARPNPLVAPDDPQAIFVEMSPRKLWQSPDPPRCGEYNQGLMRFDHEQRAILVEGDYENYLIPADSILGCQIEMLPGMQATTAAFYFVVLQVRLGSGVWELPFVPLQNISGRNNWERAVSLLAWVEDLCEQRFEGKLNPPPQPAPAGA